VTRCCGPPQRSGGFAPAPPTGSDTTSINAVTKIALDLGGTEKANLTSSGLICAACDIGSAGGNEIANLYLSSAIRGTDAAMHLQISGADTYVGLGGGAGAKFQVRDSTTAVLFQAKGTGVTPGGTSTPLGTAADPWASGYIADLHSTSGVTIGTSGTATAISLSVDGSTTWDSASIAAGACTSTTITTTGAAAGKPVFCGYSVGFAGGLIDHCYVSASNTVTFQLCNDTAAAIDPASMTITARVFQ
jgi:hypothetical protein